MQKTFYVKKEKKECVAIWRFQILANFKKKKRY